MSNPDLVGSAETTEPSAKPRPGEPRSERDAVFLERFDNWMRLPIIVSAILPIVVVPESGGWFSVTVGVVTWLVFLFDYVVHVRHLEQFRRTRFGRFDLIVVVATAPWFLLPGAQAGRFVVALRLARLARLAMASRASRRLVQRLGRVSLLAGGVTVTGALIAYYAERPTNPEFATFGDALWWGIVTLTTVGYGDIVPKTATGRWAGVMIMITGIAVLGLLSGSLASFFRLERGGGADETAATGEQFTADDVDSSGDAVGAPAAQGGPELQALTAEVSALRRQLEALTERIAGAPPGRAPGSNRPPDAAPG
jgi:voltage-gated potassium channel